MAKLEGNVHCPECGLRYEARCKCPRGDMWCANGHEWHTCTIHECVVNGPSDHSTSTFSCSCRYDSDDNNGTGVEAKPKGPTGKFGAAKKMKFMLA